MARESRLPPLGAEAAGGCCRQRCLAESSVRKIRLAIPIGLAALQCLDSHYETPAHDPALPQCLTTSHSPFCSAPFAVARHPSRSTAKHSTAQPNQHGPAPHHLPPSAHQHTHDASWITAGKESPPRPALLHSPKETPAGSPAPSYGATQVVRPPSVPLKVAPSRRLGLVPSASSATPRDRKEFSPSPPGC
ncbi:hypothetical protein PCL_08313 [Purpureocillium lilacinum]|uniref:Uncharacterized protein n=1 Tax=Purpureocillium lilacinum TaxID=33203 RepID=A0A2U3EKG9_PURLI|nr:hypothetical protein PCL_08313 [Purpureocillium lilacinum]